jgi:4-amino-4-deoxy-L-arabinose transferase-like glycosyltransferase
VRRSTIPVVLLAALSFFAGLGRGAIGDNDEAFYAESAREMVESGNWLTPHFNYEPRFQKPALYYWLTASLFAVVGPDEFAARFFAGLAGVGLVLVTTACGRRWYDESVGLLAGAIAATSFGYFALARMSLPDLPLACCVTVTIWASFVATLERERNPRKWLLLAAAAAALGFLVKGPLALVLPAIVVLPILLMERRSYNVQLSDLVLAGALFLAIALPWYLVMWMTHGTEYLSGFFIGDNFERFATDRFNDPRPWWFYLPILAGGLLPWTPLMLTWLSPVGQFFRRRRDIGVCCCGRRCRSSSSRSRSASSRATSCPCCRRSPSCWPARSSSAPASGAAWTARAAGRGRTAPSSPAACWAASSSSPSPCCSTGRGRCSSTWPS